MKSSIVELEAKATRVWIEGRNVCLTLADEREIRFPVAKNRRLRNATPQQLANVELICDGTGLHWPNLDEDLSFKESWKADSDSRNALLTVPYPGTELYEQARLNGWFTKKDKADLVETDGFQ